MKNKEAQQLNDNERNAFIERHLPTITALASRLSNDPTTVEDLTQECVLFLIDYFSERTYRSYGPNKLSVYLQTKLITHMKDKLQNEHTGKENEEKFVDLTHTPSQGDPLEMIIEKEIREMINKLLNNNLHNKRLNRLMRDRFGCHPIKELEKAGYILFDDEHHTVEEIRLWENVTRQRVNELIVNGITKLRKSSTLREYLEGEIPQVIKKNKYGIGFTFIDGQSTEVIDINSSISLTYVLKKIFVSDKAYVIKDFVNFIISKGVKEIKGLIFAEMSPSHSPFFIRYDEFMKFREEFIEMKAT